MTAQDIAIKLKKELPHLVQPGRIDSALVEVYEDALYLARLVEPLYIDNRTCSILKKYIEGYPDRIPKSYYEND